MVTYYCTESGEQELLSCMQNGCQRMIVDPRDSAVPIELRLASFCLAS